MTISLKYILLIFILLAAVFFTTSASKLKFFNVKSGSMEPAIKTGSVVAVKSDGFLISPDGETRSDLETGDIITFFQDPNSKFPVTHRIYNIQLKDGKYFYETKGDSNRSPDGNLIQASSILGKVVFTIPFFGYLLTFIKTIPGYLLLIILPAALIIFSELRMIKKELDNYYYKKFHIINPEIPRLNLKTAGTTNAVILILLLNTLTVIPGITKSNFLDTSSFQGNTIQIQEVIDNPGVQTEDKKILICHRTESPSNPFEEIEINESAWPDHDNHGDSLGSCSVEIPVDTLIPESTPSATETL